MIQPRKATERPHGKWQTSFFSHRNISIGKKNVLTILNGNLPIPMSLTRGVACTAFLSNTPTSAGRLFVGRCLPMPKCQRHPLLWLCVSFDYTFISASRFDFLLSRKVRRALRIVLLLASGGYWWAQLLCKTNLQGKMQRRICLIIQQSEKI